MRCGVVAAMAHRRDAVGLGEANVILRSFILGLATKVSR